MHLVEIWIRSSHGWRHGDSISPEFASEQERADGWKLRVDQPNLGPFCCTCRSPSLPAPTSCPCSPCPLLLPPSVHSSVAIPSSAPRSSFTNDGFPCRYNVCRPHLPQTPDALTLLCLRYGPIFVGVIFNVLLYGIMITQTYLYFNVYKKYACLHRGHHQLY